MDEERFTKKRARRNPVDNEENDALDQKDSKDDNTGNECVPFSTKRLKTENILAEVKMESNEPETEEDEKNQFGVVECENLNISEYERKREENLRDNARFLASIGVYQAKQELEISYGTQKVKKTRVNEKLKNHPKIKKTFQPVRRSARIQRIDPSGVPLPPVPIEEPVNINPRKPPENLKMEDVLTENSSCHKEMHSNFVTNLTSLTSDDLQLDIKSPSYSYLKKFLLDFSKVRITEDQVRKVVNSRIFSLVVHPTVDKVLVGAGGKWGSIGLWEVERGLFEDGAVMYYPHSKPVNCLEFNPYNLEELFSCGYDGTLRCGHFDKKIFQNIYYTPEEENLLLRNFVFLSAHELLVSQSDGNVALVDTRTEGYKSDLMFRASPKDVRTVDLHPTKPDYIVTAGLDCALCLWDIRNLKNAQKKIGSVSTRRMLNSAYFSPVTGKYILSTSQDDTLRIYDSSSLTSKMTCLHSIKHDTQTGRWLTKFRATWHPRREDLFVCGSMARPRRIELFSTEGQRVCILENLELINSVQSLNKFHPSLNVLVGANASGKLHVFMEAKD